MTTVTFMPPERLAIEEAMTSAVSDLDGAGIRLGSHGMVYLLHHRETVRALRSGAGRKPLHEEIAMALLEWARDEGDIRLYALRPALVAVEALTGRDGQAAAIAAHPPLALAAERSQSFTAHLLARMADRAP